MEFTYSPDMRKQLKLDEERNYDRKTKMGKAKDHLSIVALVATVVAFPIVIPVLAMMSEGKCYMCNTKRN